MDQSVAIINELIRSRRSIFPPSYVEKEIPREVVEAIVANANYAPTHRLTEPWRFTIFRGDGLGRLAHFMAETYKEQTAPEAFTMAKYEGLRSKVLQSSCVIAINMQLHAGKVPEWEELAAVSCAVENMWLTATAYGVGAYWSSPGNVEALGDFLGLEPPQQKCVGLFYMGYHNAPEKPAIRKPIEEKLTWVEE